MPTGPKRTQDERDRDRQEMARRLLQGETQQTIADALGVTRQQVGYDRKKLLAAWRKDAQITFEEAVGLELAKINHVETEAWRAYFRSCQNRTITTDEDLPESSAKARPKSADPFAVAKARDALMDEDLIEADDDVPDFFKSPGTQIWISRKSTRVEQRDGDPRFLVVIRHCIERRCKLLGLDAPEKLDITHRVRAAAEELGIDPDAAVVEAQRIVDAARRASA